MKRYLQLLTLALALITAASLGRSRRADAAKPPAIDQLPSPAGTGSAEPNFAMGAEGKVYLSWLEPSDSGHALRFSAYDGAAWSAARTIVARRDFFVNWADFPSLEVLDGGRLAAHWLQRNGKTTYAYGVKVAQSGDGGKSWSAPVTPHRDSTPTEHGFVAMWREKGVVGAVWLDGRKFSKEGHDATNEMMLVSTTIQPNGTLGAEVRLDERTCDCCQNAVAITSSGPVVAYRNRSAEEIRDIYVTRRVGGKWTAGAPVFADNWKIAACPVNGPAIAARDKRVALAWFTAAGDSARVKLAFSDDAGAKFGPPVRVDGGNPSGRVDVALLPDGGALVTWMERVGGDTAAVRVRRISRAGVAGAAVTVAASSAARASGFPKLAITGNAVLFAWTAPGTPGNPSAVKVARAPLSEFK